MSLENIKQSILDQASEISTASVAEANKIRDEKLSKVKAQIEQDKIERTAWIESESEAIVQRRMTLAKLESRIAVLDQKQSLIDKAYVGAYEKLASLPTKAYTAMYEKLISQFAEKDDELVLGSEDAKVFTSTWCNSICSKCSIKLSKSTFEGKGVKLSSKLADKDLSVKSLIDDVRENTEKKVIEILFQKA